MEPIQTLLDKRLLRAIEANDIDKVKINLDQGANVMAKRRHDTALLIAVHNGFIEVIRELVLRGAEIIYLTGTRDPLLEAMKQGSYEVLGSVLGVAGTPEEIAHALITLECGKSPLLVGSFGVRELIFMEQWNEVFECLCETGALAARSAEQWWQSLAVASVPSDESIYRLEKHIGPPVGTRLLIDLLGTSRPTLNVWRFMCDRGVVTADAMFKQPIRWSYKINNNFHENGLLSNNIGKSSPTGKTLFWLINHARKLPNGPTEMAAIADFAVTELLGRRGSLPLVQHYGKACGLDISMYVNCSNSDLDTPLHLLCRNHKEPAKYQKIFQYLMETGADPMQKNFKGVPACRDVIFIISLATQQNLLLLTQHGADLARGGLVWKSIENAVDINADAVNNMLSRLEEFNVFMDLSDLHDKTPHVPRQIRSVRF